jgi:protein-ribulosamine 3-kinase
VKLPPAIAAEVEATLTARGGALRRIKRVSAVGGGCISPTARIEVDEDDAFFLKWSSESLPPGMLEAEARALAMLASARAVRVPAVVGSGGPPGPEWLLLEWLEPGAARAGTWERLGEALAELHRHRGEWFGAVPDNFIGSLPQSNPPSEDWAGFWATERLAPQVRAATDSGLLDGSDHERFRTLFTRLGDLLAVALDEGPSLLHGDLWGGNVHILADGSPAVVDPSTYYGHREVDLAMAALFGGFGAGFREAYQATWPLTPGYEPTRRAVYQLYYLLVHVNLFGAGYVRGTRRALREAGV